jgi:hypothetical protein
VTSYSLFNQAAETVTSAGTGNNGTNGLHFTVSVASTLAGIWHYSPSGYSQTQLPVTIGLYTTQSSPSTGTLVTSQAATWSGAAGSGWVFAAFTSPPSLASGTAYMAVQFRNDATDGWFCFTDPFTWPVTSGIVTAPEDVSTGQGWYNIGTALAFPATQLAGYNWWMDVQVTTSGPSPFTSRGKAADRRPSARKGSGRGVSGHYTAPAAHPSPFTLPRAAASRHPSARKGAGKGLAGAPWKAVFSSGRYILDTAGQPILDTAGLNIEDTAPAVAPFTSPGTAVKGKSSARRGSCSGSAGAPAAVVVSHPAPFAQPGKAVTGKRSARRGSSAGSPGAPRHPHPSPFAAPLKALIGRPSARKGSGSGSAGAPRRPRPSPFAVPARAVAPHPSARKGSSSGTAGAPFRALPSRFAQPNRAVKGKAAARKGAASGSAGAPWQGGPVAPRRLLVSLAARAGTDDYGNTYPQGLMVTSGEISGTTFDGTNWTQNPSGSFFYSGSTETDNDILDEAGNPVFDEGGGNVEDESAPPALIASIAPQAGTDEFGNPYMAGIYLYGPGASYAGLQENGTSAAVVLAPPGTTQTTLNPQAFAFASNTGDADEFQWLVLTSGKESGNADAALQLNSESADGTVQANATVEFGGTTVARFNPAGIYTEQAFIATGIATTPAEVSGSAVVFATGNGSLNVVDGTDGEPYATQRRSIVTPSAQTINSTSFQTWASSTVGPRTYRIHGQAYVTPNQSAGGMAFQWGAPSGTTGLITFVVLEGTSSWSTGPQAFGSSANPGITMNDTLVYVVQIEGTATIANAGTIEFQAADVNSGDTFDIAAASFVDIMPV